MKIRNFILSTMSVLLLAPAAHAVVVVGGDNGWEVSFDGNVNGFYVYSDRDDTPSNLSTRTITVTNGDVAAVGTPGTAGFVPAIPAGTITTTGAADSTLVTQNVVVGTREGGTIGGPGDSTSRIRTGLLPAFFSFNVRSPEVNGLTGSARISFAPQIQNANTKNNFGNGTQAGSQIDLREVFFNIEGSFGTVSVGRTLSLFQRHNILTDMTLFGVGAEGGSNAGGTTLGRIGYGYVYPQFNARISYRTPNVNGFQAELGIYDPSSICGANGYTPGVSNCATETDSPRWEGEATYTTAFDNGNLKFFLSGMFQNAERAGVSAISAAASTSTTAAVTARAPVQSLDVDAQGFAGGVVLDFSGVQLVASGYSGEALGTLLQLDRDSLDYVGRERDHDGYILQGSYTFNGITKVGVSYGVSSADETADDSARRGGVAQPNHAATFANTPIASGCGTATAGTSPAAGTCNATSGSRVALEENSSLTFGIYHDVTSWFKVSAEYSKVENQWFDGRSQEADVYAIGAFFLW